MSEEPVHDNDEEDNPDIFGTDATLQVTVRPTWYQHRGSALKNTLRIIGYLQLVDSDGSLTRLDAFHIGVSSRGLPGQIDDFFRRCHGGLPPHWDSEEVCDLCIVPFVRLFGGSTATLSRVPAGPDATGSDDE